MPANEIALPVAALERCDELRAFGCIDSFLGPGQESSSKSCAKAERTMIDELGCPAIAQADEV
ncbi:hypothetical protein ACWGS9_34525 [Bradyrhizobium sp. Arg314]